MLGSVLHNRTQVHADVTLETLEMDDVETREDGRQARRGGEEGKGRLLWTAEWCTGCIELVGWRSFRCVRALWVRATDAPLRTRLKGDATRVQPRRRPVNVIIRALTMWNFGNSTFWMHVRGGPSAVMKSRIALFCLALPCLALPCLASPRPTIGRLADGGQFVLVVRNSSSSCTHAAGLNLSASL